MQIMKPLTICALTGTMLVELTAAAHLCSAVTTVDNPMKYIHGEHIAVNVDN